MSTLETKEWRDEVKRTYNGQPWPRGEWDGEPDRAQWQDEATGLPCLAVRSDLGHWCGYVGVPEGHVAHGADYNRVEVDVHGGLTYADKCSGRICHVVPDGEPEVFWLGFDCAHSGDVGPTERLHSWGSSYGAYRTLGYVRRQCRELAAQLAVLAALRAPYEWEAE